MTQAFEKVVQSPFDFAVLLAMMLSSP